MVKWPLALIVYLSAFTNAFAFPPEFHELQCKSAFRGGLQFTRDDEVSAISRTLLERIGKKAVVVVCTGDMAPLDLVHSRMAPDGFDSFFLIAIHPDFRLALSDEILGIVAHEVAHVSVVDQTDCNALLEKSKDAYIECEHRVDKEGERLVGKGQVVRALRFVDEFLGQTRGVGDLLAQQIRHDVRRRIFLLR